MCVNGEGIAASAPVMPLQTVEYVDLSRYVGEWYEIARLPNSFQNGCVGSKAVYAKRADGEIDVVNSCLDADSGEARSAKGRAWVVDQAGNARLKVSFFWPFRGDYWIIELGKEYEYAVIGTPSRKYLWILSRNPEMPEFLFSEIMKRAERQGFAVKNVVKSSQK
jgi:apolipoprotein D and lipocalin family protein